jgi:hypothetical protein
VQAAIASSGCAALLELIQESRSLTIWAVCASAVAEMPVGMARRRATAQLWSIFMACRFLSGGLPLRQAYLVVAARPSRGIALYRPYNPHRLRQGNRCLQMGVRDNAAGGGLRPVKGWQHPHADFAGHAAA